MVVFDLNVHDPETKLGKYFKLKEFACNDGTNIVLVDLKLVVIANKIREYVNQAVYLTSAYRTPFWNRKYKGSSTSQHKLGKALDFTFSNIPNMFEEIATYVKKLGVKGIGLYYEENFIHIDVRVTEPKKWIQKDGQLIQIEF